MEYKNSKLSIQTIDYACDVSYINLWEHKFYKDIANTKNPTLKQHNKFIEINTKIIKSLTF